MLLNVRGSSPVFVIDCIGHFDSVRKFLDNVTTTLKYLHVKRPLSLDFYFRFFLARHRNKSAGSAVIAIAASLF